MKKEDIEILASEAFGLSVQALALSKTISELALTDEQRGMIPELFKKHVIEIANETSGRIGLELDATLRSLLHSTKG